MLRKKKEKMVFGLKSGKATSTTEDGANGAATPRESRDGYEGARLTRTLSQEINDLRIREKQILEQLASRTKPRGIPNGVGGDSSEGEGDGSNASPLSTSFEHQLRRRADSGGSDKSPGRAFSPSPDEALLRDCDLEDSQHGQGAVLSAVQKEERMQRERVHHMVVNLMFSAARGRLSSCKRKATALESNGMFLTDPTCCDYDKRTPLHLSAAEGSFRVTEWLLTEKRVNPNPIDRFGNTPLQGAIWGDHKMIVSLLVEYGGMVVESGNLVEYKPLHAIGSFAELSTLGSMPSLHQLSQTDSRNLASSDLMCLEDEFWEISADTVEKSSKLGAGEFGTVYKATWNETPVAMKVLKHSDNLAIGEFVTEMNMMRKLHHPNIVQFLGGCTKTKPYFIVTELSAAGSLADVFYMKQKLPLTRLLELAIDCATGMAYLHSSAIKKPATLHRDLKPANLMIFGTANAHLDKERSLELLVRSGTLKVTDFGLSKTLGDVAPKKSGANSYTLTGETGSYRYMAPEVYRHEDYNHKVDVYAYAMILYQMFEGRPPFVMLEPQQAAVAAAINGLRPKFTELKKPGSRQKLRNLVEQCWAADRDTRPDFKDTIPILHECLQDAIKEEKQAKKKWYQL